MTYALVVQSGVKNFVAPGGQRHQAGDHFTLTDAGFGLLTAGAKALLSPDTGAGGSGATGYLGGTVSHQVTIASGKTGVLPDGLRHKAGDVVVLSDQQYSTIPASAKSALFSADTTTLT